MKLILSSKEQRRSLLVNSKEASSFSDIDLKDIIVVRDLTPEQRKTNKALTEEKKAKEKEGRRVSARHGEVVNTRDTPESTFQSN